MAAYGTMDRVMAYGTKDRAIITYGTKDRALAFGTKDRAIKSLPHHKFHTCWSLSLLFEGKSKENDQN